MTERLNVSRRGFLGGTGLALLGLALPAGLTACSSGGSSGALKLWMDITGTPNQKYFDQHVAKTFTKDTGVDLNTTYYQGQDLRRLVQTALQAKSGPDVVRGASATLTLQWAQAHLLTDLTPYAEKYKWNDTLLRWSIDAFTHDGKLWALPLRVDTMLLYFNKSLFADKGWTLPKTRDELEALATEAKGQGIIPFGASNVDWKAGPEWLMTVFWNHYSGPDAFYKVLTGESSFSDPTMVEAVALIKSYFDKGWFGGGVDKYFAVPSQQMGADFGNGKIAMFPQGEWWMSAVGGFFGKAANNDNEWDWGPFPSLRSEVPYPTYEVGIGGSLGINAASKNKDDAAKFLDWYYTKKGEAIERMADVPATYNIPIALSSGDLPATMDPRSKRLLTAVTDAVDQGNYGYVTWTWLPAKTDTYVFEGLEQVLTGKISPKDYCAKLDTLFKQERSAGAVPKVIRRGSGQ